MLSNLVIGIGAVLVMTAGALAIYLIAAIIHLLFHAWQEWRSYGYESCPFCKWFL